MFGGGADPTAQTLKQELDTLLAAYKAYGLPLPPEDAIMVRYRFQASWTTAAGTKPDATHGLAFLLKPAKQREESDVLAGLWRSPKSSYEKLEVVEAKPELLKRIDEPSDPLIQAIQCHARGWPELSQALLERVNERDRTLSIQLAHEAWMFWIWNQNSPTVDWAKLAPQLRVILNREPKGFAPQHAEFVRFMELALKPSSAKPGSVDALLDDFIRASTRTVLLREPNADATFALMASLREDPRYIKINLLGFDAVPALLAHLEDDRLTRIRVHGEIDAIPGYQCRIRHIVSDLLEELAVADLGRESRRGENHFVDKAKAEAWWKEARELGEEAYCLRHVVGASPDAGGTHQLMLDIIAKKYPRHLPALYRKILDERPKMSGWAVADAIVRSDVSKVEQRELFLKAAASKNVDRRCEGLAYLHDLDPKRFDAIMIVSIGEIEDSPLGYDARFAQLAQETANADVWAALQGVAARAFPPARQGYIDAVGNQEKRKPGDKRRLHFLAHFMKDSTPGRYRSEIGSLEVGNNAVRNLAKVLGLQVDPQPAWTDAQWRVLRKEVKAALEAAGIK